MQQARRAKAASATLGDMFAQKVAPGADDEALRALRLLCKSPEPLTMGQAFGRPAPWHKRLLLLLASVRIVDGAFAVCVDGTGQDLKFSCPNPRGVETLLGSGRWLAPYVKRALAEELFEPKKEEPKPKPKLELELELELLETKKAEQDPPDLKPKNPVSFGWRQFASSDHLLFDRAEQLERLLVLAAQSPAPLPRRQLFQPGFGSVRLQRAVLRRLISAKALVRVGERLDTAYVAGPGLQAFLSDPDAIFDCAMIPEPDPPKPKDEPGVESEPEDSANEIVDEKMLADGLAQMLADVHRLMPQYLEVLQWHAQRLEAVEKQLEALAKALGVK